MAIAKRVWTAQTWIEGDGTPTYTTLSGVTEEYSSTVDLETNGYDLLVLWPEVDFDLTPTDNVEFRVYSSPDAGVSWTNIPAYPITIDNATDTSRLEIEIVNPPPHIRVGFVQTGSTDSHDVRCSYKASRWDIT